MNILKKYNFFFVLIKHEFSRNYFGSYLGTLWLFLNPLIFLTLIYFVFNFGLKITSGPSGVPFFYWLVAGMIPWLFISDSLLSGTNSITSKTFLIKKVNFNSRILPIISVIPSFILHLFLIVLMLLVMTIVNFEISLFWLQLFFYMSISLLLVLSISMITSALQIFIKDIQLIISTLLLFGFWGTPIFWSVDLIPQKYLFFMKLNPFFYIIEGYRDSLFYQVWFWDKPLWTIFMICLLSLLFCFGFILNRRLRPFFGDMV